MQKYGMLKQSQINSLYVPDSGGISRIPSSGGPTVTDTHFQHVNTTT